MSPPIDVPSNPNEPIRFSLPQRKKQKLGKGLSALMGDTRREETVAIG